MSGSMYALLVFILFLRLPAQTIHLQETSRNISQKTTFLSATISSSADLLALSGSDKSVKIFDATTLKEKISLQNENLKVFSLVFSYDGKNLIACSQDGSISVWDITRPAAQNIFMHGMSIRSIDVDPAGRLISGGYDRSAKMWDYITGAQIGKFPELTGEITALSFSPNGKFAAAGSADGAISLLDANTFGVNSTDTQKRSYAFTIRFSADGKYFSAAHKDSTISIWNANGTFVKNLKSSSGPVTSIAFHPNNNFLFAASSVISCWDISGEKIIYSIPDSSFTPLLLAVQPQKKTLVAAGLNGEIRTYQILDKKPDQSSPNITIVSPQSPHSEPVKIFGNETAVSGIISDESPITEVKINEVSVPLTLATTRERELMDTAYSVVTFSATVPLPISGTNTISVSATDKVGNSGNKEINVIKLTKDAAVELVNPKESIETDQISIELQFKVWFDFTSYSVQLNTIEIAKKENIPKKPYGAVRTEKLSLSAGLNQIQLTVNGRGGERIRKTINITRRVLGSTALNPEDKPLKNTSGQPQRWAVVVGVSEYGNPAIKNLVYADRDAKSFAEFLKTPSGGGFEEDRVKILLNKNATLQNIKQALFNFLRQTVDKDLVVIYFAGHGAPEPANPNNNYLLCYDTDPNSLETTAFPMWDVNTALTRYIPSKRVVVFTDACHSGGISTDIATRGMSATNDNLINQYLSDLSKTKEGIIVFTASQAGEVSQELEKFGHGVFTYFLLEGMKGKADFNNDYTVTIGELMDYVEEKVKRQTNGNQHPTRNQGTYDKDLTISLVPN